MLERIGLEVLCDDSDRQLPGRRFGLLMNQASVNRDLEYACDALARRFPGQLAALFSPQHGLWGEQQANMIESQHGTYSSLGIPVYSLYSETRRPTDEMLDDLDCLLIDLQDVGTRVYTFVWTMLHCLQACADRNVPVLVLDRPNPLGGTVAEGPLLEKEFCSFVGNATIPMRHALTLGELSQLLNAEQDIHADLTVIRMDGWKRDMAWPDTQRIWIAPSPNLPRFQSVLLYPGMVLLEGTNLSEGRGTTTPFEFFGAPFIDPHELLDQLGNSRQHGVTLMPVYFQPTFDKWQGQSCGGVALRVQPGHTPVHSFELTARLVLAVAQQWPDEFQFLPPPYEYEDRLMPIDILFGSERFREAAVAGGADISSLCRLSTETWWPRVEPYLLY